MQFDLIALDADDTLWQNEIYYRQGRATFNQVLANYGITEPNEARLHELEIANLDYYGYGAVGFAVSMAEAAVEMTDGQISSRDLLELLNVSKKIISADVELLDGTVNTVKKLAKSHTLMLITKGNELHQASKIKRSGLKKYFKHIEIVADKSPQTYSEILENLNVLPEKFVMIGNAMRSDILPVLEIGGFAVYIHNDLTWSHEHAEFETLSRQRFFDIEKINALPALIARLEQ
jgi:putative hydrolase of the HAD superfamily